MDENFAEKLAQLLALKGAGLSAFPVAQADQLIEWVANAVAHIATLEAALRELTECVEGDIEANKDVYAIPLRRAREALGAV